MLTSDIMCHGAAKSCVLQVFPTLVNGLPLKEDYAENAVVYSCATQVFQTQYPAVSVR